MLPLFFASYPGSPYTFFALIEGARVPEKKLPEKKKDSPALYDSFIADYYDESPIVRQRTQDVAFYRQAVREFGDFGLVAFLLDGFLRDGAQGLFIRVRSSASFGALQ